MCIMCSKIRPVLDICEQLELEELRLKLINFRVAFLRMLSDRPEGKNLLWNTKNDVNSK